MSKIVNQNITKIFADQDDQIPFIIENILDTQTEKVILVLPTGSESFSNVVSLRILSKEILRLNKVVIIQTKDKRAEKLAQDVYLVVVTDLDRIDNKKWQLAEDLKDSFMKKIDNKKRELVSLRQTASQDEEKENKEIEEVSEIEPENKSNDSIQFDNKNSTNSKNKKDDQLEKTEILNNKNENKVSLITTKHNETQNHQVNLDEIRLKYDEVVENDQDPALLNFNEKIKNSLKESEIVAHSSNLNNNDLNPDFVEKNDGKNISTEVNEKETESQTQQVEIGNNKANFETEEKVVTPTFEELYNTYKLQKDRVEANPNLPTKKKFNGKIVNENGIIIVSGGDAAEFGELQSRIVSDGIEQVSMMQKKKF